MTAKKRHLKTAKIMCLSPIKYFIFLLIIFYIFFVFLDFIPFGYYYGDTAVGYWLDAVSCFSVSNNFPLFTKKNHKRICVSQLISKNIKVIVLYILFIFVHVYKQLLGIYITNISIIFIFNLSRCLLFLCFNGFDGK